MALKSVQPNRHVPESSEPAVQRQTWAARLCERMPQFVTGKAHPSPQSLTGITRGRYAAGASGADVRRECAADDGTNNLSNVLYSEMYV
jgi:hypothetical protein